MKNHELLIINYKLRLAKILGGLFFLIVSTFNANAQSINQNFPTPIKTNEISGRISARDLGDARLTSYFYTFDGTQGDVFINVITTNFNGDIDIFTAENLRPLTKITAYADSSNNETGRVVYLRQPLKLILRIEGRTPNDDAATFQIKFAGSFAPSTAIAETDVEPEVKSNNNSDVRVNSVGTIIEVKPKLTPTPKEAIAKVERQPRKAKPEIVSEDEEQPELKESVTKEAIVKKEPKPKKEKPVKPQPPAVAIEKTPEKEDETAEINEAETKKNTEIKIEKEETSAVKEPKEKKKPNEIKAVSPSELANINLVILFKDGKKLERPMSEVLKFSVDKGILTVISKDGAIGRYSILDVEKMTIE